MGWVVNGTPRSLSPRARDPVPSYRWLGGPQGRSRLHWDSFFFSLSLYFIRTSCPDCPGFLPFVLTVQHTQHKHTCPRRDSNPQFQQSSCRRLPPQTARPLGSARFDPQTVQPVACRYTDWAISARAAKDMCMSLSRQKTLRMWTAVPLFLTNNCTQTSLNQ